MAVMVCALVCEEPVFQATSAATERHPVLPHSSVAFHLRDDLDDAAVDRVALTGQLRQLPEQHLQTRLSGNVSRAGRVRRRRHNTIKAAGYDKLGIARASVSPTGARSGVSEIGTQWVPGPSPGQPAPSTTRVRSPKKLPSGFGIQ